MSQSSLNKADDPQVAALEATISRLENDVRAMTRDQAEHERHITFLRGILEQSLAGIYVISNGQFDYVNQTFADIFGYASPAEIISSIKVEDLVSPECRELVLGNIRKRTTGAVNELRYAFTGLRKDGARNLIDVHGRVLESAGQRMVIGLLLDMTNFERANALAFYDSLTGLPNRALFLDRLTQAIKQAQRNHESFALLFMDLDGFKRVNDTQGHIAGDRVLQEVSRRLLQLFRESDTVARFGGDEFVAIMPGDNAIIEQRAASVIQSMVIPVQLDKGTTTIGISIGIGLFPANGEDTHNLIVSADAAMYLAKQSGKSTYCFANNLINPEFSSPKI